MKIYDALKFTQTFVVDARRGNMSTYQNAEN